jgi:hypothetical protein
MGLMTRLRDNTHIILWMLVIAFGLIWVMTDAGLFEALGTQRMHVGEVNGHAISYQEYTETVDRYLQAYQQQTGESATPQMVELYRDMAWQSLTNEILRQELARRLGLRVSDSEILELVVGENPDPFIQQQFAGPDGRIDRNALLAAIRAPETREGWLQVEQYLRRKREAEKLEQLIATIARVSEGEIRQQYYLENKAVDIEYIVLPYADIPQSEIKITDGDLRRSYSAQRERYRVPASYSIEYVLFSKKPSREDTLRTLEELAQLKEEFARAENSARKPVPIFARVFDAGRYGRAHCQRRIRRSGGRGSWAHQRRFCRASDQGSGDPPKCKPRRACSAYSDLGGGGQGRGASSGGGGAAPVAGRRGFRHRGSAVIWAGLARGAWSKSLKRPPFRLVPVSSSDRWKPASGFISFVSKLGVRQNTGWPI